MSALALSVVLSFVSAVAYAGGAIIQEQVALTSPGQAYAPVRRPGWWAAVALTGLGGLLHVVALAFGPLSLVQPLGALTIVFALPMAALFVGRKAGAAAWRGAIMATVGLAGLLSLVGSSDANSLNSAQRLALGVVAGGSVVALMVAGRAAHRHPAVRSILLAVGAGIAFSMSSVYTKTVAVDWSRHVSLADLSSLAAIGVFATAGMLLSQASYRGAGLEAPLATLTVVNPVVAAAVGITMFGETFRYGTTGTALALGCGVVAAGGLILLTSERISSGAARSGSEAKQPAAETETVPRDEAEGVSPADGPTPEAAPVSGPSAVGPVGPVAPVVPSDLGALTSLTASEASVRELLAGLPDQTGDDALYHPAPHSAAGIVPVPTAGPTGGTVLVPEAQPGGGTVLVPTPLKAPAPGVDAAAPEKPSARDELPYLTAMLGVPYVPMPFVNHHRTRVRS
ncbi:DMT family transporter [Streptomyces sp. NBC_01281]|uniref:DMT family transporter n=1 Tax=unclassified Streptomyces TaxID=2593676 RepID=UPI002E151336|nr:DMT family transporter [Streptomyces sp. NBC_01281]